MELVQLVEVHNLKDTNVIHQLRTSLSIDFYFIVLFRVFDRDHDGLLNHSDILYMSSCLTEVAQFIYISNPSSEIYTDKILSKLEDFLIWCQQDSLTIQLLDLIFQISHIVLGLRPTFQQDEVIIVK